jgi:isorenieratene synthase
MFHIYFLGSSEGLIFDVANANFDVALWNPLRQYLESRGARFHTGVAVEGVATEPRLQVRIRSGGEFDCDGVVLATDVAGLQHIVDGSPELGDDGWRARVAAMGTAPPFVVQRLWLDRPVFSDRAPFLGTGGRPPLDNVSVLQRYEREAKAWSDRTGGSVVELHSYSVTGPTDDLGPRMLARLYELYPEARGAKIVHERVLTRSDCPRFAPGDHAARPTVATPHPAVMLAGDGIRIDLPVALMERAATTGWSAANRLLAHYGLAGHQLHTVPVEGRSSALRRLAQRERQLVP